MVEEPELVLRFDTDHSIPQGIVDEVHTATKVIYETVCNHLLWWNGTLEPEATTSTFTLDGHKYTIKISKDEKAT